MKRPKHYLSFIALFAMLLAAPSCKDDDKSDDSNQDEQVEESVEDIAEIANEDLASIISVWCTQGKNELPADFATKTFAPKIGLELHPETPQTRYICAATEADADAAAGRLLSSLGFDIDKPDGFTYSSASFGKVTYRHANSNDDANTTGIIEVDMKTIPTLSEIRFVKDMGTNDGNDPYYRVGDIVKYKNKVYVCVANHQKGESATWLTFDGEHSIGKCSWMTMGKDYVYNDKMAMGVTISEWLKNIILVPSVYNNLVQHAGNHLKSIAPPQDYKADFLKSLVFSDEDYSAILDLHSSKSSTKFNEQITMRHRRDSIIKSKSEIEYRFAPKLLLCDKMRWAMGTSNHYWVPYIIIVEVSKEESREYVENIMDKYPSQNDLDADHFYMTTQKRFTVSSTGKEYTIYTVAAYWQHKSFDVTFNDQKYKAKATFNFTTTDLVEGEPDDKWHGRSITSSAFSETDNGVADKDFEEIYVQSSANAEK